MVVSRMYIIFCFLHAGMRTTESIVKGVCVETHELQTLCKVVHQCKHELKLPFNVKYGENQEIEINTLGGAQCLTWLNNVKLYGMSF
jgi:hypothetical protein